MTKREYSPAVRFLLVLIAGFALLLGLLGVSVWVGVRAIRSTELTATRLVEEQRATLRLIEDIQQEQDSLSDIFYSLAVDQGVENRTDALKSLRNLESTIRLTLTAGESSAHPEYWNDVGSAVNVFIAEGRQIIESGKRPGGSFFRSHENLISTLGRLAAQNFDAAAVAEKRQAQTAGELVSSSLFFLSAALSLAVLGAILTVWIVTRMYRRLQWQTLELAHLSSRTMADQEKTARRFSRELHDEFGQVLSAIEAGLVSMFKARKYDHARMEDSLKMIKAAIGNARDLSQLLRPTVLDDFGLDASLRWLAEGFSQRTGIHVEYVSAGVPRIGGEEETHLFRIAQEALTNVSRHAQATYVRMELEQAGDALSLTVSDNGQGFSGSKTQTGLGLVGMRARSRASDGTLTVSSSPGKGVTIKAEVKVNKEAFDAQNSDHRG